jgi:Protein of unknown function (DUF3617)
MRIIILFGLAAALAGCDGGTAANNQSAAPAPPENLPTGQYELAGAVTSFTKADHGTPRINAPVGTRSTASVCVGPGAQAPVSLFAEAGYDCTVSNYYARNGHLNIALLCRKSGLSGSIPVSIDGTFTADGLDYTRNVRTVLTTDGDVEINVHITGRHTGACTPAAGG